MSKNYQILEKQDLAIQTLSQLTDYYIAHKMNVRLINNLRKKAALHNLLGDYYKAKDILNQALPFAEIEEK